MNRFLIFLLVLFFAACTSPAPKKALLRQSSDTAKYSSRHIMITVDSSQQYYLGNKSVDSRLVDSLLVAEIGKRIEIADTPAVVINADTATFYGNIFRLTTVAKRAGARVVVNVR